MASMFKPSKPEPDAEAQKAQRRQSKSIEDDTADEAIELGSRNRLLAAGRKSGGLLSRRGGAAGVKETLG